MWSENRYGRYRMELVSIEVAALVIDGYLEGNLRCEPGLTLSGLHRCKDSITWTFLGGEGEYDVLHLSCNGRQMVRITFEDTIRTTICEWFRVSYTLNWRDGNDDDDPRVWTPEPTPTFGKKLDIPTMTAA